MNITGNINQTAEIQPLLKLKFVGKKPHHFCMSPQGKVWKHSRQPFISSQKKVITGPPEVLKGSRSNTIMKMHGELSSFSFRLLRLSGSVNEPKEMLSRPLLFSMRCLQHEICVKYKTHISFMFIWDT